MRTRWVLGLSAALGTAALLLSGIAEARPGERLRARIAERMAARQDSASRAPSGLAPSAPAAQTIAYGTDPLQALDFWAAQGEAGKAPLVIYVHGGGWKRGDKGNATGGWKVPHYTGAGYAFASINYRLVPAATVEQQAADVVSALKTLIDRAEALGVDRRRIVLMGHSAGAHLVALVGTDERYLRAAGMTFADITGVIPIDGAAYDVSAQMQDGPQVMQGTYRQAFGTDPARQRALSPTMQAAAPNAPAFLLLHVQRPDGVRQAQALGAALAAAGTAVEFGSFPGEGLQGHMVINRSLGDPAYAATPVVDRWLAARFAQ